MVLLIPRRIKQIKDEGRAEGREEGFKIGFAEGFVEGFQETYQKSRKAGRAQEREAIDGILARYDRGEITAEQTHALLTSRDRLDCNGG